MQLPCEPEDLVNREGEQPKHQMRHDFLGSADVYGASAKFVLEPRVNAFSHGSLLEALLFEPSERTGRFGFDDHAFA